MVLRKPDINALHISPLLVKILIPLLQPDNVTISTNRFNNKKLITFVVFDECLKLCVLP
jgi:hypothetical protein